MYNTQTPRDNVVWHHATVTRRVGEMAKLFVEAGVIALTAFISPFRAGEIKEFTGILSPYEIPASPEWVVETGTLSLDASADKVLQLLCERGILKAVP